MPSSTTPNRVVQGCLPYTASANGSLLMTTCLHGHDLGVQAVKAEASSEEEESSEEESEEKPAPTKQKKRKAEGVRLQSMAALEAHQEFTALFLQGLRCHWGAR